MIDAPWEAAEIAASLTTYIVGIEDTLREPMMGAVAHLAVQIDEIYDVLGPIVDEALDSITVMLPWET